MNMNESELEHFSALAKEWWKPRGELKTLHVINPLRLNFIINTIDIKNKTILDVGCGGGLLCEGMACASANVTGIDISEKLINVAIAHATENKLKIDYQTSTIEKFADTTQNKYDAVTCMELLEHVPDPLSVLKSISRVLNPGGHLILSTINRTIKSYINMILGAEYIFNILPKNTHQYSQFIKPSELYNWLHQAGFELHEITGIKYIPVLDHASLVSDPSINYMVHAVLNN